MNIKVLNSETSLSVKVDGTHIPLEKFRKLIDAFMETLNEIDKETSDDQNRTIFWDIRSLTYNSPLLLEIEATPNSKSIDTRRPIKVINTFRDG